MNAAITPATTSPATTSPATTAAAKNAPVNDVSAAVAAADLRNDWQLDEIEALFTLPFQDLLFRAQTVHRAYHAPNTVQMSTLLSVKTGACPEDCAYCPQSVRYDTGLDREALLAVADVAARAKAAREAGATRFCMGAAWRSPKKRDLEVMTAMIREVKSLGLESCATLGMLSRE
ncbi:MAG: hypothetical protein ACKO3O_11045, partial [Gammaproteobacteria bacterium]